MRKLNEDRHNLTSNALKRGVSEGEIDEPPANIMLEIASYKEATSSLQDVLNFLEAKGNTKTANDPAKVIDCVYLSKGEANRSSQTFSKTV